MTVDLVNLPPHYVSHPSGIECIDVVAELPHVIANAVKYVWRSELKDGRQAYEKAEFYLKRARNLSLLYQFPPTIYSVVASEPEAWKRNYYLALVNHNIDEALYLLEGVLREQS